MATKSYFRGNYKGCYWKHSWYWCYLVPLDLQPPMQSVPITTKVLSSNPIHDEVYST